MNAFDCASVFSYKQTCKDITIVIVGGVGWWGGGGVDGGTKAEINFSAHCVTTIYFSKKPGFINH